MAAVYSSHACLKKTLVSRDVAIKTKGVWLPAITATTGDHPGVWNLWEPVGRGRAFPYVLILDAADLGWEDQWLGEDQRACKRLCGFLEVKTVATIK